MQVQNCAFKLTKASIDVDMSIIVLAFLRFGRLNHFTVCILQATLLFMKYSIEKTPIFDKWLSKLKDNTAKIAILMRIMRAENGNFGDIKSVGTPVQ